MSSATTSVPHGTHRRRRTVTVVLALALAGTACGGSSDTAGTAGTTPNGTAPADRTPAGSTPSDTTPNDTTPAGSTPVDTAGPDTTPAATPGISVAVGADWTEWLVARRIVRNDGYWKVAPGAALPVEARTYWMRCDDGPCISPTFESRLMSETEPNGLYETAMVEGAELTWTATTPIECIDSETGETLGELADTWALDRIDDAGSVWSGTYEFALTYASLPDCSGEGISYDATMTLFDPTVVAVAEGTDAVGFWLGESAESIRVETGIRACAEGEGCDLVSRVARDGFRYDAPGGPGETRTFRDIPLTRQSDGSYYGTADYPTNCVTDLTDDGEFAAEYLTTHQVWLTVYDLGADAPERFVAEVDQEISSVPHPDQSADDAARCEPVEPTTDRLIALPNDTPTVIDWDVPANEAIRVPTDG